MGEASARPRRGGNRTAPARAAAAACHRSRATTTTSDTRLRFSLLRTLQEEVILHLKRGALREGTETPAVKRTVERPAITGSGSFWHLALRTGKRRSGRTGLDVAQERGKIQQTRHRIDACPVPVQQGCQQRTNGGGSTSAGRHAGGNRQLKRRQQFVERPVTLRLSPGKAGGFVL